MLAGRYQVGEIIGRGGMADVFEGVDLRLGRKIAIKLLKSDLANDENFESRFAQTICRTPFLPSNITQLISCHFRFHLLG